MTTFPERYCGPPGTANGGYACGVVAAALPDIEVVEVTLRQPVPLQRELELRTSGTRVELRDGEVLVAEGEPGAVDTALPQVVGPDLAAAAATRYWGFTDHPFPGCFVCGVDRPGNDGMEIFAGPIDDAYSMVASPWTPAPDLASAGQVEAPFVWAALDCPSGFAVMRPDRRPCVLGRYAVRIDAPILSGEPHVVVGWETGAEGRRHYSASAILDSDGEVRASSAGTWIELKVP